MAMFWSILGLRTKLIGRKCSKFNGEMDNVDKILESLASGTNSKEAITSQYIKTTAQYDSCNKASHTQSQSIHLVRNIAYPSE
jgi:hypothetical protein